MHLLWLLLTVHLSIFISIINQPDAQNFCASSWLITEINAFVGFYIISKEHMLYTSLSVSIILSNADKIYEVSTNKRPNNLMPRTLLWLWSTQGTWAADCTHHTPMYSAMALSTCLLMGIKVRTVAYQRSVSMSTVTRVTACFSLTSVTHC